MRCLPHGSGTKKSSLSYRRLRAPASASILGPRSGGRLTRRDIASRSCSLFSLLHPSFLACRRPVFDEEHRARRYLPTYFCEFDLDWTRVAYLDFGILPSEKTRSIMADALCGPSNALQNFQKHTAVDRTLQQDRLISRQSPGQQVWCSMVKTTADRYGIDMCYLRVSARNIPMPMFWTLSSRHSKTTLPEMLLC